MRYMYIQYMWTIYVLHFSVIRNDSIHCTLHVHVHVHVCLQLALTAKYYRSLFLERQKVLKRGGKKMGGAI